jgi:hypothetical protein
MIPVVLLSAPAAGDKSFSWRMFYTQLGKELKEPLMDKKQEDRLQDGRRSLCHISSGSTVTGLRLAIEDTIKLRKTVLVIVDEAIHFIRQAKWISKTNGLDSQMDALKSLTIMEDAYLTIALVGCYDLFQIMFINDQLTRRTSPVHFKRYLSGVEIDEAAFRKSIRFLQKYLPLSDVPDLTAFSDVLMESCVGCVGILKETLQRALSHALRNKGKWTDVCLQKALLSEMQINTILEATLEGEKDIDDAIIGSKYFKELSKKHRHDNE